MNALVLLSSLAMGGAERVTVSFLRRLAQRGHPLVLCTVSSRQDETLAAEVEEAGVVRRDLAARRLADPRAFASYVRMLQRERFDLVHAHGQDAGILAAGASRFTRTPYVVTRHVVEEPVVNWRQEVRARASLGAARRASAVLAVSSAAADRLSQIARLPRERIAVIPNGVEIERFASGRRPGRVNVLRDELGIRPEEKVILLPAALRHGKGHDVLVEAWPLIRERVPNARVVFAGGGERECELRRHCAPCEPRILFLGWRSDVAELMAASDVVVLPSFSEALPTVLVEAAAAGRPVVASRVGGIPEVVIDGETGLLVDPGDVVGLAASISALLLEPARAHAMGDRARLRASRLFSLDAQIEKTLAVWSKVA